MIFDFDDLYLKVSSKINKRVNNELFRLYDSCLSPNVEESLSIEKIKILKKADVLIQDVFKELKEENNGKHKR